jgi:regulator of ribosome biosynthesis
MHVAKKATASLGKFQPKLAKEKPLKGNGGKKRQFEPLVMDSTKEKNKNLDVLARVMSKKPKVDLEKSVNSRVRPSAPARSDDPE